MIQKVGLWRGAVVEAYRGAPEAWLESIKPSDILMERHDLASVDASSAVESEFDFLGFNEDHFDLLAEDRYVLIENINAWNAPEIKKLVVFLQKADTSLYLALTQSKDAEAIKVVKDIVDDDHDFIVPSKEEEFAKWLKKFLSDRRVDVSLEDARRIAETAGEARDAGVAVARSLVLSSEGTTVTWKEDISKLFTKMGFVSPYKLTGAIAKGDIKESLVTLRRLTDGAMAPLAILGMIRKRYQSYMTSLSYRSQQDYAKVAGGNPYAAKFVYQEGHELGATRTAKALMLIAQADNEMKGGLGGLPATTSIEMLVTELASQFRAAKKR